MFNGLKQIEPKKDTKHDLIEQVLFQDVFILTYS